MRTVVYVVATIGLALAALFSALAGELPTLYAL